VKIDRVELIHIELPLVHFFETSFGRTYSRSIVLVRVYGDGLVGYGECVAGKAPLYSYETTETCWYVLKEFLVPLLLNKELAGASVVYDMLVSIRGHRMAKAALENACWDLEAKLRGVPLFRFLGGERLTISSGVSLGIEDSPDELLTRVEHYLSLGYRRIKVKIKPGWDTDVLSALRRSFPEAPLMVDANGAYTLEDMDTLKRLDDYHLMMIEQPLHYEDLADHARLQSQLQTPLCLDESITSSRQGERAIELGSCRIINIKQGRVGGLSQAKLLHDICLANRIPVWCGGMLESGIGRAHNIALSTLKNFTLPGDISASDRYYKEDIIDPPVTVDRNGNITVPTEPGIGFLPNQRRIDRITTRREVITG